MATMCFAMWLQESDPTGNRHLIMIFLGLMAIAIFGLAIFMAVFSVKAFRAIKDLTDAAAEFKGKVVPLLDEATAFAKSGREVLQDAAPKVKMITDSLVKTSETLAETSNIARSAMGQIDATITDANLRTQRQVARVDGMITAALTTTTEVVEAVSSGIRVPAQKIVAMAGQAKLVFDGLLAKIKARTASRQNPDQS